MGKNKSEGKESEEVRDGLAWGFGSKTRGKRERATRRPDSRPREVRRARTRLTKRMKRAGEELKLEVRVDGESIIMVKGVLTGCTEKKKKRDARRREG